MTDQNAPPLPIDPILPDVCAQLAQAGQVVLEAPPGAGKTTRLPLALLKAGFANHGRIVMLEPRRLAARGAAARMAAALDEQIGQTIGLRMRGQSQTSAQTQIEVVTEGVLTRMIQSNPELPGVSVVIFDEFHERSLNADLGLALCLEIREALRDDLKLVVMSATLDAAPVAQLMGDSPMLRAMGRSFPVTDQYLDKPRPKDQPLDRAMADLILQALETAPGSLLAFLPGQREIEATTRALTPRLPADCTLHPLYGALPFAQQQAAIAPAAAGRKIVLATSIAQTSLTIDGIGIVVDSGLARDAEFDPGSGMSRLITRKATRAEAIQRAGRAGRLGPGAAFKLWTRGEEGAMPAFPKPEIEAADLAPLALELALWGAPPDQLKFLSPPPQGTMAEARALLQMLGMLDGSGRITDHGRAAAKLPLHPRLAHMLLIAGASAAPLAALLGERDPLGAGAPVDLSLRIKAIQGDRIAQPIKQNLLAQIRTEAKRLAKLAPADGADMDLPMQAALAYPDRIAKRRPGEAPRFLLSGGKGAVLAQEDPLAGAPFVVATDLDGNPREARIRAAVQITLPQIEALMGDQIRWQDSCTWDKRQRKVEARRQRQLGALVLENRHWKDAPPDHIAAAMLDGVRDLGLTLDNRAQSFLARLALARSAAPDLPQITQDWLETHLDQWLLPHLGNCRSAADWRAFDILPALHALLDWGQMQALDRLVPGSFTTPLGRKIAIDYTADAPEISLRLQEMFGQTTHPMLGTQPLRITLLSPAGRPVQTTTDIAQFWRSSYADVRKDMRGRYPKHPWPEDPSQADPTLRTKRKGV